MKTFFNSSLPEKYNRLSGFAKTFWPGLDSLTEQRRLIGTGDVLTFLYTIPLAVIGLAWLILSTDLDIIQEHILFYLLNL